MLTLKQVAQWCDGSVAPEHANIEITGVSTDTRAIRTMIKVAREGGTVALAPEGNRTYSGKTEYMRPATDAVREYPHL